MLAPSSEPSSSEGEQSHEEAKGDERSCMAIKGATITTTSGVPRYYTFKIKEVIQGQQVAALVDSEATHNFIDAALVAKRGISTKDFEGFNIVVADGYNMTCTRRIPCLKVTLGNSTLINDFYVNE